MSEEGGGSDFVVKPPRPEMSNRAPAPIPPTIPPPRAVKVSRVFWLLSFVAGLTGMVFAFFARDTQLTELQSLVTDLQPDRDAETVKTAATIVFWGSLGALAAVVLAEAILLAAMMRRRGGARWLLLLLLLVHGAVAVLVAAFVVRQGDAGLTVLALVAAQLLLAALGWIVSFLPGAGRWFRAGTRGRGIRS
ncbi:hypothetical protein [Salinibacterium sp. ZJ454]|uniref:hypothetical protein n=1 Tax=Salinibacterium sp. ZJ454 TaxID=2708339 RepID=UPI001423BBD2|nr:hypothetical protein [Salinibacterium sp. ZJ454]